jgi:tetratricopeptide (TPR) repeat protein
MMTRKLRLLPIWLFSAAAISFLLPARPAHAQSNPGSPAKAPVASPIQIAPAKTAEAAKAPEAAAKEPDRAQAYYHLALARLDEEEAANGRAEYVTQAIEEYKLALNADPTSPELNDALADLYFRTGRAHEAESTARELLRPPPRPPAMGWTRQSRSSRRLSRWSRRASRIEWSWASFTP